MKLRIAFFVIWSGVLALLIFSPVRHFDPDIWKLQEVLAQQGLTNTFNVGQFFGGTVGDKLTRAQNACLPDTNVPCILIIDPGLNVVPVGNMPGRCANCTWLDYRAGFSPTPFNPSAFNNDLWLGGGLYTSIPSCYSAAVPGQNCNIPANWNEPPWTSDFTLNKNGVGLVSHGGNSANTFGNNIINMGTHHLIYADGTLDGFIRAEASQLTFKFTGTGAAFIVGTAGSTSAITNSFDLTNVQVDISNADTSALCFDTYGLNQPNWKKVGCIGKTSSVTSQIGLRMNANAVTDGEGALFSEMEISTCGTGVQLNSTTYKTFIEVNFPIVCTGGNAAVGWDFNGAAAIHVIGGSTNGGAGGYATAYQFRNGASINSVISGCESATNAATFDATVSNNTVQCTNGGNFHDPTFAAGNTNNVLQQGSRYFSGGAGSNSPLVAYATNGFPTVGWIDPTGAADQKNWDALATKNNFGIRALTDNNATANVALQCNRGSATTVTSCQIGSLNDTSHVLFQPDSFTFANLGTPANGSMVFCSNCTIANPCASGGTGAIAKRLNGAWVCN
ncbi:MAG TPA: hypothetical protein VKW06_07855 [Candidatus Angelobacter sp.]|nr:hypothetical protein [Candidatus Angelobacter sp.]